MYRFENALINGASGGLGSQFAEELLKRGAGKVFVTYRSDAGLGGCNGRLEALIQNYPDRIFPVKAQAQSSFSPVGPSGSMFKFLLTCIHLCMLVYIIYGALETQTEL